MNQAILYRSYSCWMWLDAWKIHGGMYNIHNIEILFAQGVLLDLTHRQPTKRKVKHCHMKSVQIKTALNYRGYLSQTVC